MESLAKASAEGGKALEQARNDARLHAEDLQDAGVDEDREQRIHQHPVMKHSEFYFLIPARERFVI